jgi:hypothetical protein
MKEAAMSKGAWILVIVSGLILVIFGAGFVPGGAACKEHPSALSAPPAPTSVPRPHYYDGVAAAGTGGEDSHRVVFAVHAPDPKPGRLLALTASPDYRRAAEFSLKVEDCTKAEDALESKLEGIKGEILEMVMEGTEGARTCTLSVLIPADRFRGFIGDLRQMGKVQSERITASKIKPGGVHPGVDPKEEPDPRELSLVSIRMADEKVAQNVLQSRGLLASSFDQGASHFMNGMAVLVECFGYMLPYAIVLFALVAPMVVIARVRRARSTA